MSDYQNIANAIARFFAAVDRRDWEQARALMTNPFHLDYSSYGAGDPADMDPADVLANWQTILPGFDWTHHQIGNVDIEFENEKANVACYGTASHVIDDRCWTVVGTYRNTLVRSDHAWKLAGSQFLFKYQVGATELVAEAQRRVADRN